MSRGGCSL
eukprot:gene26040-biopygen17916